MNQEDFHFRSGIECELKFTKTNVWIVRYRLKSKFTRNVVDSKSYIFCSINYWSPWGTTWNEKSRVAPSFPPTCDSFSSLDLPPSSRFVVQIKKGFEKYTRSKNETRFQKVYTHFSDTYQGLWFIDTSILLPFFYSILIPWIILLIRRNFCNRLIKING